MSMFEEFDVIDFAKRTHVAIDTLLPWCQVAIADCNLPGPSQEVAKQAIAYMRAINLSMQAAEHGFVIAEEAIDLGIILQTASIDEGERLRYLQGMIQLATDGRSKAEETMIAFSGVSGRIEMLVEKLRLTSAALQGNVPLYDPAKIEAWIPPLSEFASSVSKFAEWWTVISMEDNANKRRAEVLLRFQNRIMEERLAGSWKKLQQQHAAYIFEIDTCINQHPEFLDVLDRLKKKPGALEKPTFSSYSPSDACSEETVVDTTNEDYLEVLNKHMYYDVPLAVVFQSVSTIKKDTTQFVVRFECGSSAHKIKRLKLEWKFKIADQKNGSDEDGPRVVDIAPMNCIGYLGQELINKKWGLEVPLGFALAGFSVGANLGIENQVAKTEHYGMSIVGVNQRTKCSWTLKENRSSASGIPPHFQLRFTLKHNGSFSVSLKAEAKIKLYRYMPSKRRRIIGEKNIDVLKLQKAVVACSLGGKGGDDDFNGEVPNAFTAFHQPAVPRK